MLDENSIAALLDRVSRQEQTVPDAVAELRRLPFERVDGFAVLDHHRLLRRGCPEVIYCAGKTPAQVASIAEALARRGPRILGTRASEAHFHAARTSVPDIQFDPVSRCLWLEREPERSLKDGIVLMSAGTSDLPIVEEAARTLAFLGQAPRRIHDVGVAGLHRLLAVLPDLCQANVIIVAAGMEGALPSVVAGLVSAPVIAIPTSIGYGASFGGLAALLGMLNTCATGVAVVNIDNGFGAAHLAAQINARIPDAPPAAANMDSR
jgi:NCAIR mutase (PurE)-related protein